MDATTLLELNRLKGWLTYYQGSFYKAIEFFETNINLAQSMGEIFRAESSIHFLGRTYADLSKQLHLNNQSQKQSDQYENYALKWFNRAISLHEKYGSETQTAYDYLRIAQLKRETDYITASKARIKAFHMFGNQRANLFVTTEEALIKIQDVDYTTASRKQVKRQLITAVEGWAEVNYAKGMADAIKELGLEEQLNGRKSNQALEYYIAAILIYPFEKKYNNVN